MAVIKAFRGLRYDFSRAGRPEDVVCPPYDVISEAERAVLAARSPYNAVRLELPVGEDKYRRAAGLLEEFESCGALYTEKTPCIYYYEQDYTVGGDKKTIGGLIARVALAEPGEGGIVPHENTLSAPKQDRFDLLTATGCSFSPVYALYSDPSRGIAAEVEKIKSAAPDFSLVSDDGNTHRLRTCSDSATITAITELFADKRLFIADGHHRYETALNYRRSLIAQGVEITPDHPANYVMMLLADLADPGLSVLPIHRLIKGMPELRGESFAASLEKDFDVKRLPNPETAEKQVAGSEKIAFGLYTGGDFWYLLALRDPASVERAAAALPSALRGLDITALHSLVLEPIGIDRENMAAQRNLTYTKSATELVECVKSGEFDAGIILRGTRVGQITAVADSGEKMPQKSTWFYPKPITGAVMNKLI